MASGETMVGIMLNNITVHAKEIKRWSPNITKELHDELQFIGITGVISAILSFIGSTSVIGFIAWKRLLKNSQVQPLLHLSVADWILSSLWIITTIKYFFGDQYHPEFTAFSCFVWQLLTELIHLVTFFLTVNYSVNVYLKMKDRTIQVHMISGSDGGSEGGDLPHSLFRKRLKNALYILSWCLPTVLMLPVIINIRFDDISAYQKCVILIDVPMLDYASSKVPWWYGYTILSLSLTISTLAIIILYCLTLRLYWKVVPGFHTDHQRRQLSNMQSRVTLYMLVFMFCWAPAIVISYHKWIYNEAIENQHRIRKVTFQFSLYVCQAICAPLQGLLNSIVYGWTRKSFRRAELSRAPTPYLREPLIARNYDFPSPSASQMGESFEAEEENVAWSPVSYPIPT